jgi:isopentenyl-diphosphate Delta-isomerase
VSREAALVELVDERGTPTGATTVAHAHTWPGSLHRAFSVLLLDRRGRLLLQQRAAAKNRFALRWANACCGHPGPGQRPRDAALARLHEELGLDLDAVQPVGRFVYRAGDPVSGQVEHEYDHVLVGWVDWSVQLAPDGAEVADLRWVAPDELRAGLRAEPDTYAPWLSDVVSVWHDFRSRGGLRAAD